MPSTTVGAKLSGAALACVWLAMLLAGGSELDRVILAALYIGDDPALLPAALRVTRAGAWLSLTALTFGAAALLWLLDGKRREAVLLLLIVFSGRAMVELQKYLVDRARPAEEHLETVHSMSFPSAHAANSMIVFLSIALLMFGNRLLIAAALLISFAIGLSRVMLGVHWPSDVVGGWTFGLFWTLAFIRLAGPIGTRRRLRDLDSEGDHP